MFEILNVERVVHRLFDFHILPFVHCSFITGSSDSVRSSVCVFCVGVEAREERQSERRAQRHFDENGGARAAESKLESQGFSTVGERSSAASFHRAAARPPGACRACRAACLACSAPSVSKLFVAECRHWLNALRPSLACQRDPSHGRRLGAASRVLKACLTLLRPRAISCQRAV